MGLYQMLDESYKEFKTQEKLSLKETENNCNKTIKESSNPNEKKEIEDRIGELRQSLKDGAISDDEKEAVEKEIAELESKLAECDKSDMKECTKSNLEEGDSEYNIINLFHNIAVSSLALSKEMKPYANDPEFRTELSKRNNFKQLKEEIKDLNQIVPLNESESSQKDDTSKVIPLKDGEGCCKDLEDSLAKINSILETINIEGSVDTDLLKSTLTEVSELIGGKVEEDGQTIEDPEQPIDEGVNCNKGNMNETEDAPELLRDLRTKDNAKGIQQLVDVLDISKETKDKLYAILNDEVFNPKTDIETLRSKVYQIIKDANELTNSEDIKECEIQSFRVLRKAPKASAYMIEAQTKEGIKYLTGKNFDSKTNVLEEAEIFENKSSL